MTDYKALYEQANEMDKDELVSSIVSMEVNIMKLKEEINHKNQKFIEWIEENKELKQEIEKLNEEGDELCEKLNEKQEELNEESQQKLKNKECWMSVQSKYKKLEKENEELKVHFNLIIELIKGCKTKEQLQKLKELGTLN